MTRSALVAGAAALLAVAVGCGGSTAPAPTPPGNYTISTVNGKAPPVALASSGSYTYEVTAGTLTLTTDGKYSVTTTFRQTIPGNVSTFVDSTSGTWLLTGGGTKIQFSMAQGPAQAAAARFARLAALRAQASPIIWPLMASDSATWSNAQLTFSETDGSVTVPYVYARK